MESQKDNELQGNKDFSKDFGYKMDPYQFFFRISDEKRTNKMRKDCGS